MGAQSTSKKGHKPIIINYHRKAPKAEAGPSRPWVDLPPNIIVHIAHACSKSDANSLRCTCKSFYELITGVVRSLVLPPCALLRAKSYPNLTRLALDALRISSRRRWFEWFNDRPPSDTYPPLSVAARHQASMEHKPELGAAMDMRMERLTGIPSRARRLPDFQLLAGFRLPALTALELEVAATALVQLPNCITAPLQKLRDLRLSITEPLIFMPPWVIGLTAHTRLDLYLDANNATSAAALQGNAFGFSGLISWPASVAAMTRLRSLRFGCMGGAMPSVEGLWHLTRLELFRVSRLPVGLSTLTNLQALTVYRVNLTDHMVQQIGATQSLTRLVMYQCTLPTDAELLQPLLQPLSDLTRLCSLTLTSKQLTMWPEFVPTLPRLAALSLAIVSGQELALPADVTRLQRLGSFTLHAMQSSNVGVLTKLWALKSLMLNTLVGKKDLEALEGAGVKVVHGRHEKWDVAHSQDGMLGPASAGEEDVFDWM